VLSSKQRHSTFCLLSAHLMLIACLCTVRNGWHLTILASTNNFVRFPVTFLLTGGLVAACFLCADFLLITYWKPLLSLCKRLTIKGVLKLPARLLRSDLDWRPEYLPVAGAAVVAGTLAVLQRLLLEHV